MGKKAEELIEKRMKEWNKFFLLFKAYMKKHGHGEIFTQKSGERSTPLGVWVGKQRSRRNAPGNDGRLTDEQLQKLESAGFLWKSCRNDMHWISRFDELVKYKEKFGHTLVPRTFKIGKMVLGTFVSLQRTHFADGTLKPDRKAKLDAIGFQFSPGGKTALKAIWESHFNELKAFYESKAPKTISDSLDAWATTQRRRGRYGLLSKERVEKLKLIGQDIEVEYEINRSDEMIAAWDKKYEELKAFQQKYGHCNPFLPAPNALISWVSLQRQRKEGTASPALSHDEMERLDRLGFIWYALGRERQWEDMLQKMLAYKEKHGGKKVRDNFYDDYTLRRWVGTQRRLYNTGMLRKDRQAKLEAVDFSYTVDVTKLRRHRVSFWRKQYNKLLDFRQEYGHCLVPTYGRWTDNSLSSFVSLQRRLNKKGKLPEELKELLDEIGFIWAIKHDDATTSVLQQVWNDRFEQMVQHHKKYGSFTGVTGKDEIQAWGVRQRKEYRNGRLAPGREERLRSIGFFDFEKNGGEVCRHFPVRHSRPSLPSLVLSSAQSDGKKATRTVRKSSRVSKRPSRESLKRKRTTYFSDVDDGSDYLCDSEQSDYEADTEAEDGESEDENEMEIPSIGSSFFLARYANFNNDDDFLAKDTNTEVASDPMLATSTVNDGGSDTDPENYDASGDACLDVELEENFVGRRVAVYWSGDDAYYEGFVSRQRKGDKIYVEYDDGEAEWADSGNRIKLLEDDDAISDHGDGETELFERRDNTNKRNEDVAQRESGDTEQAESNNNSMQNEDAVQRENAEVKPFECNRSIMRHEDVVQHETKPVKEGAKWEKNKTLRPIEQLFDYYREHEI